MSKSRNYQKSRHCFDKQGRNRAMRYMRPFEELQGTYVFEIVTWGDREGELRTIKSETCGEYGWNENYPSYAGGYS